MLAIHPEDADLFYKIVVPAGVICGGIATGAALYVRKTVKLAMLSLELRLRKHLSEEYVREKSCGQYRASNSLRIERVEAALKVPRHHTQEPA